MVHKIKRLFTLKRRYVSERLEDPEKFDPESFRTIIVDGHRITIGCPIETVDSRCPIGTRAQRILHPIKEFKEKYPRHYEALIRAKGREIWLPPTR